MTQENTFRQAALAYLDLVELITPDKWQLPGLGTWTIRDLVGHTARAIATVDQRLSAPEPTEVTVPDAATYYITMLGGFTDNDAIAARGVEAGRMIGRNPVGTITTVLGGVTALLDAQPENRIVGIGPMSMPLHEYLRTRIFELVVHSLDIAKAADLPLELPAFLIADAASLAARVAVLRGDGRDVLFALTGRGTLREGFTIL